MKLYLLLFLVLVSSFVSCTDYWDDHYGEDISLNMKLWEKLKTIDEYSEFLKYLEIFELDTIIKSDNTKTVFVVGNESLAGYLSGDTSRFRDIMKYHIIPTSFMLRNVENNQFRHFKTLSEKFAPVQNINQTYYFDGNKVLNSSPLYQDGKYYEIEQVAVSRPNLYEYIKSNNADINQYIKSREIIVLDRELSKPIGFNDLGQTIYDSVKTVSNLYEEEYFPISREFRNIAATIVLPNQITFNNALDEMAGFLGDAYTSHQDIPDQWKNEVLIPVLLHKGTYAGVKNISDFNQKKIQNITGDSITIDFKINPASLFFCSNGLIYDYESFSVDKKLYREKMIEGETLCRAIGLNRFAWINEKVHIGGNTTFEPIKREVLNASNDSILIVEFGRNYQQDYSLTIKLKNVFPQRYRLVWRTSYRTTGLYSIHVNGEKILLGLNQEEQFDTQRLTSGFWSVLGHRFYSDARGYCNIDGWVENITEYGDVTIKLEYQGKGAGSDNGLIIDYIQLLPE